MSRGPARPGRAELNRAELNEPTRRKGFVIRVRSKIGANPRGADHHEPWVITDKVRRLIDPEFDQSGTVEMKSPTRRATSRTHTEVNNCPRATLKVLTRPYDCSLQKQSRSEMSQCDYLYVLCARKLCRQAREITFNALTKIH